MIIRTSLTFRLMPRLGVNIDCSAISEAGHVIPEGYGPISVQAFLDNVMASDNSLLNGSDSHHVRPFSVGKAVKYKCAKELAYSSEQTLFVLADEIVFSRFSFSIFVESGLKSGVSLLNSGLSFSHL